MILRTATLSLVLGCVPVEPTPSQPSLWGPPIAEDLDPDDSKVEVVLEARATEVNWNREVATEQWAYNGQIPGPVIEMTLGQTLRVEFTNQIPQDTTIHWHGLRIPNAMDGVPLVQDPIFA